DTYCGANLSSVHKSNTSLIYSGWRILLKNFNPK
ncbi:unnamed protein product, partial [Adineta steineri]